jgi:UDP-2,4-diacetamido-2,4,6-trideoxy-beta-L-altropyranose hydrolase
MEEQKLLIRADASTRIGVGHLMRCLALGQAWKDAGGEVIFITACSNEPLLQRLYDDGFEVHRLDYSYPDAQDWQMTRRLLAEHPAAWLVLDGYHFDSTYQWQVKEAGYRLLVIDDMAHLPHYYADIVLNQNIHAESLSYSCESYTRLLLGTKYVLLRREFLKWQGWKREIPDVARKILVTLGGADPENVTLKVIQALQKIDMPNLELKIIVGPCNRHLKSLKDAMLSAPCSMQILQEVNIMSDLMAWADVTVSAAGSTSWELAFMGLPGVILILGENQERAAQILTERKVFISPQYECNSGVQNVAKPLRNLMLDLRMRQNLSQNGRLLVDGLGVCRIIEALS